MGTHLEAVKSLGQQTFSFLCFYVRPPSFQEQSWSNISSVTLQPLRNNIHLLHDPTFPPSPSSPWEITFSSPPWYQTSPLHPQPHMSSLYAASLILHTVFPPPQPILQPHPRGTSTTHRFSPLTCFVSCAGCCTRTERLGLSGPVDSSSYPAQEKKEKSEVSHVGSESRA